MDFLAKRVDFPCKDCLDRYFGCWGDCEKYKASRAEYDKLKGAMTAERDCSQYTISAIRKNQDRAAKRKRDSYQRRRNRGA